MARIAGVDLPKNKRIEYGLTYIYGIGVSLSHKILALTGVNPDTRVKDLTEAEIVKLREAVSRYKVEGDLRHEVMSNLKRLMDIGAYRGMRHRKGLPSRGQRTRTNARTRKGKRMVVAVKRKVTKETGPGPGAKETKEGGEK